MPKIYRTVAAVLAVWMLVWIYLSWPYGQDDAFIHLRYADHLLHQHIVSYDGVHRSFGSSSLLYITLLASLRAFTTSPVLPRAVSSVAHVLLFFGLAVGLERALKNAPRVVWLFAMLLLGILVMPSAVRWLDDGMETSLCLCLVALLVFALARFAKHTPNPFALLWLAVLGFLLVLARVEFLLLTGFAAVMLLSAQPGPLHTMSGKILRVVRGAAPLVGGLAAAALTVAWMHSLLPDTAVAKSLGLSAWHGSLSMTVSILESSFAFGIVSLLLWLLSFATLARHRYSLTTVVANLLFPCVVFLAILRGQAIQGIRYLEWTLFFSLLWNILQLADISDSLPQRTTRFASIAAYGLFAVLLLAAPLEAHFLRPVFDSRADTLNRFRTEHFELLRGQHGITTEVGTIGYFTGADICDPFGLVDGRAFARLSYPQRLATCAASHPDFLFASQDLIGDLAVPLGLDSWVSCGTYSFANIQYKDEHYLLAPPWNAALVCKATGQRPVPLRQAMSGR